MPNIFIPTNSAEQWAQFLAEPVKHWQKGFSARTLAYSWQEAQGFPEEVVAVLGTVEQFKGSSFSSPYRSIRCLFLAAHDHRRTTFGV